MNITLVGFMGSGKTSVGKAVAKKKGMRFIDTDDVIEEDSGMKISHIFSEFGEKYFRELEKKAVAKVSKMDGVVISAGGGAVLNQENVENLRSNGPVICLKASPEEILRRVEKETHRPLLKVPDPLKRVKELLEQRAPYYAKADEAVETTGKTIEEVAGEVLRIAGEWKK